MSFVSGIRIDLMAYLFGDILAVTPSDLAVIWGSALLVLLLIGWRWSALLTSTLNPDLAHAAGIDLKREQLALILSLAIVVAVANKVVGVLLIAAMLIIPAAAARPFSRTPEMIAVIAALVGSTAVLSGLKVAYEFNTPTGPTIVSVAAVWFMASLYRNRPGS